MDTKNKVEGYGAENNQEVRVSRYKLHFCKVFFCLDYNIFQGVSLMLLNKKQVFIFLYSVK